MFLALLAIGWVLPLQAQPPATLQPLLRAVDLNVGDSREIELADGAKAHVKLLDLKETRDDLRQAVRRAEVLVEVNRHESVAGFGQLSPAGSRWRGADRLPDYAGLPQQ